MTEQKPDMLQRLMAYKDKLDAGGELTEEEKDDLQDIAEYVSELITAFITAAQEAFAPIIEVLTKALQDFWDSLTTEVQETLRQQTSPRLEWALGDVATPYQEGAAQTAPYSAAQQRVMQSPYDSPIVPPYRHFADRLKGDLS